MVLVIQLSLVVLRRSWEGLDMTGRCLGVWEVTLMPLGSQGSSREPQG